MLRHLRVAFDDFNGFDATQRVVWDLSALGIGSATGVRPRRHAGTADFTEIRQPWLQAVVMQWARTGGVADLPHGAHRPRLASGRVGHGPVAVHRRPDCTIPSDPPAPQEAPPTQQIHSVRPDRGC